MRRAALATLIVALPAATAGALETVEEIDACVKANAPTRASVQTVILRTVAPGGSESESKAEVYWKRFDDGYSRVLLELTEPLTRRGSAVLAIETEGDPEIYMYMPELRKVKRITADALSGEVFGTVITYEDFERWQRLAREAKRTRLGDAEIEGRAVYVIEGRPARGETSEYERVVSYVDQQTCIALRVEQVQPGGVLRKVLTAPAAQITEEPSGWVPRLVRVEDVVEEIHTDVIVEEIDTAAEIPDRRFTVGDLERRGR